MKSKIAVMCLSIFVLSTSIYAEDLIEVRIDKIQTTEDPEISAIDFHYDGTITPLSYHFQFWVRNEFIAEWMVNDLLRIDLATFLKGASNRIVKNKCFYVRNLDKGNEAKAVIYKQWEEDPRP